jgi:hypothetical protein
MTNKARKERKQARTHARNPFDSTTTTINTPKINPHTKKKKKKTPQISQISQYLQQQQQKMFLVSIIHKEAEAKPCMDLSHTNPLLQNYKIPKNHNTWTTNS